MSNNYEQPEYKAEDEWFRGYLALAADSAEKLRDSDVDRIMTDCHGNDKSDGKWTENFRAWLLAKPLKPETKAAVINWKPE